MIRSTTWCRPRRGFTVLLDGESVPAGALVELPADHAAGLVHALDPARPWWPTRIAWRIGRRLRLARKALAEARKQRRRLRAWRQRRMARTGR